MEEETDMVIGGESAAPSIDFIVVKGALYPRKDVFEDTLLELVQ